MGGKGRIRGGKGKAREGNVGGRRKEREDGKG